VDELDERPAGSKLLDKVVLPALANAEMEFGIALSRINVEDMTRIAESMAKLAAESDARVEQH
jgi:hypothetical protein